MPEACLANVSECLSIRNIKVAPKGGKTEREKELYRAKFALLHIVLVSDPSDMASSPSTTNSGKWKTIIDSLAEANGV